MSMITFGQAACNPGSACYVSLAVAAVVGAAVGFVAGRCGRKDGCTCKKGAPARKSGPVQPRREVRPPEARVAIPAGSVEIYVGNLSYEMSEEDLRKAFEAFGTVSSARVVTNRFNNKSKGFGFVVMPNRPEAEKAIAAMSEKEVMGRKMRVNEAKNTLKEEEA
ncbi:MAG: RNA recognition motif domain-containing protein [Kiritimatiellia bacterium]